MIILGSTITQTCPKVFGKPFGELNTEIGNVDALYPSDLAANDYGTAKANALKQTKAARNLFYKPNDKILNFLKSVAKNFEALISKNEFASFNFLDFINSDEQRQTSKSGTAQETYNETFNLFNTKDVFIPDVKVATIKKLLTSIQGTPKPSEIVAFLGFLGDVGDCTQDSFGRKDTNSDKQAIANIIVSYVNNLKDVSTDFYTKYSPDNYYNIQGKQSKPGERKSCFDKTVKKPNPKNNNVEEDKNMAKMNPRSGVMDTGAAADAALGVTSNKIPAVGWPWQTVP